jgi:hypothetical protein
MTITIPEGWLGEAKYPVVVDPVIGTNTVGAYAEFYVLPRWMEEYWLDLYSDDPDMTLEEYIGDTTSITLDRSAVLNRYTTPVKLSGLYNAYIYADFSYADTPETAMPLLYSNNGGSPKTRLCIPGGPVNCRVDGGNPKGWRQGTFSVPNEIGVNTPVWFGFTGSEVGLRFDYGLPFWEGMDCYLDGNWAQHGYSSMDEMLQDFGMDDASIFDLPYFLDPNGDEYNVYPGCRFDFRISMYFEPCSTAYTRTLTQGVTLLDNRKRIHGMARVLTQTINLSQITGKAHTVIRKAAEAVGIGATSGRTHNAVREASQTTGISDNTIHEKGMYRFIVNLLGGDRYGGVVEFLGVYYLCRWADGGGGGGEGVCLE